MKARGFGLIELAIYAAIAAAIAGIIWSAYLWIDHTWETSAGIKLGKEQKDAEYRERDAKATLEATRKKAADDARVRAAEDAATKAQSAAASEYERGKSDGKKLSESDRARVRSGALVLRDPGAKPCPADVPSVDAARAGAGRGANDATRAELPGALAGAFSAESSEWLLDFANEADDAVKQLTGVQKALRACVDLSRK